jgi:molecular chaperone GrpE
LPDERTVPDAPQPPGKRPGGAGQAAPKTDLRKAVDDAVAIWEVPSSIVNNGEAGQADSAAEHLIDLHAMLSNLEERLLDAFDQKLAFDAFKERQIDRLHAEVQGYKADLFLKAARPLIAAMIKLHADTGRLISGISREDPTKLTVERIVGIFAAFRDEITDLLAAQGVEAFHAAVDDHRFDARRQSSVGMVETSNPELVGRIAEIVQPGFEQGSTMLSKEKVKIYSTVRSDSREPQPSPVTVERNI